MADEELRIYELAEQTALDDGDAFIIDQDGNAAAHYITAANLFATNPGSLMIGGGTAISYHVSVTATWNPDSLLTGASTTYSLTVAGATYGDIVMCGMTSLYQGQMNLYGAVTSPGIVMVTLKNDTTGTVNLGSGTLRVSVWQY